MKKKICQYLSKVLVEMSEEELMKTMEIPPEEKMGDLALPCFTMAKKMRKNPMQIAVELAEKLKEQKDELDELEKKFPIINIFCEGKAVTAGATREDMEAIQKYMELKFEMQNHIEREHYFRGYRDCILFLVHCGALGTNFEID